MQMEMGVFLSFFFPLFFLLHMCFPSAFFLSIDNSENILCMVLMYDNAAYIV